MDLALDNLQRLICHETQNKQPSAHLQMAQSAGAVEEADFISA